MQIRRADDAAEPVGQRRSARDGQRKPSQAAPRPRAFPPPAAPEVERLPGLAGDRPHDREAARRAVAGQDRRTHDGNAGQAAGQLVERRRRYGRDAARARDHADAGRTCLRVQPRNAGDEAGVIGEVEIVATGANRRARHTVRVLAIGLERPGGIDDDRRLYRCQHRFQILVAIHGQRRAAIGAAVCFGLFRRAARHDDFGAGRADQPPGQPAAEHAIAAQDQDFFSQ